MVNHLSIQSTVALLMAVAAITSNAQNTTATTTTTSTSSGVPAQVSPAWLSDIVPIAGNVKEYPSGTNATIPTGALATVNFTTTGYPEGWKSPSTTSAEVQAVVKALDWTKVTYILHLILMILTFFFSFQKVPSSAVRKADSNGDLTMTGYDSNSDPDCWWSASGCVKSKNASIPADVAACPEVGDWGLVNIY